MFARNGPLLRKNIMIQTRYLLTTPTLTIAHFKETFPATTPVVDCLSALSVTATQIVLKCTRQHRPMKQLCSDRCSHTFWPPNVKNWTVFLDRITTTRIKPLLIAKTSANRGRIPVFICHLKSVSVTDVARFIKLITEECPLVGKSPTHFLPYSSFT